MARYLRVFPLNYIEYSEPCILCFLNFFIYLNKNATKPRKTPVGNAEFQQQNKDRSHTRKWKERGALQALFFSLYSY